MARRPRGGDRPSGAGLPPEQAALARELRAYGLTRRRLLRSAGYGGVALLGGGALAACGIGDTGGGGGGNGGQPEEDAAGGNGEVGGELRISNWPLYIDEDDEGNRPTLQDFEAETGVTVDYVEDINSNDEYFGQIRNQLDAGQDIGRDLIVLTDWMAGRLINLGWLEEIDHDNVPNMANLLPALAEVEFDPGRRYSLTWQSGMTGIGYDPEVVGRELESVVDLFADDLAGRVTFLTEMRDTMGLVMASMGIDPANHEFSDFERAIERVQEAVDSGQLRGFTGNEYTGDLAAGNIAAAIAWSGDIIQLQLDNPNLQFLIPADGALLWSDNMLIPANAANKRNAEAFMDFVYQPEIAAQIAEWVNFICPVEGAREAMEDLDPELAEDELIFPSEDTLANTFEFKVLDEDEEAEYQRLFQAVIGA